MFSQAVAAAFIALPLLVQSVFAADCTRSYTVKEGDICDRISAANNVSTYQLAAVNSGIDEACSNLVPGSTLCLGRSGEDCSTTYTVIADDTCELITSNNRINSTILYLNNPQINQDCSNIYIGEVLCVGDKVQVPPAPGGSFVPGATIPATAAPAKSTPHSAPENTHKASTPLTTPPPKAPVKDAQGHDDDDDEEDLPFCDEL